MTDRELMKQALEALELLARLPTETALDYADNSITALRERLAQPEQEPVVGEYATCLEDGERVLIASVLPVGYGGNKNRTVRVVWSDGTDGVFTLFQFAKLFTPVSRPTAPPQRKPLTDEEIEEAFQQAAGADEETHVRFARVIEAKLKEKNT